MSAAAVASPMRDLRTARADRLAAAYELLESCHGPDGMPVVDLDTVAYVMAQALEEIPDAPITKEMDKEEEVVFLALAALLVGVQDMLHLVAQRQKPGSYKRALLEFRRDFWERVIVPRLSQLPPDRRIELFAHSQGWGYSLWAPGHQLQLIEILRRVAGGSKSFTKAQRAAAEELVGHLEAYMPAVKAEAGAAGNDL